MSRGATQASSSDGTALLALLGIVIEGIDAVLGLNCSPISVIGVGTGNACSSNVVCCDNNNVVSVPFVYQA